MKNNIWKYIRSRPGMPAVVNCVAYKSKANVTADYDNIKYYFQAPQDQISGAQNHWESQWFWDPEIWSWAQGSWRVPLMESSLVLLYDFAC